MILKLRALVLTIFAVLTLAATTVEAGEREILVKYRDGYAPSRIRASSLAASPVPGLEKLKILKIKVPSGADTDQVLASLNNDPGVEFAQFNYRYSALQVTPGDPGFSRQWSLPKMRLPEAWGMTTGSQDILVAVVDSGVDLTNLEFQERLQPGFNFVGNNGNPQDDNGHGTAVAGIIAANANNNTGLAGVDWRVRLLPVKVLDRDGEGNTEMLASGIIWAADQGARVINLSLGGETPDPALEDAINLVLAKGVVVVAAAGNDEKEHLINYPAAYPGVLAVGATDQNDEVASFSSYGPELDLTAPGDLMPVLAAGQSNPILKGGTSMAAPHVAGVVSLMLARNPRLSRQAVAWILEKSAVDILTPGPDLQSGAGRVDALEAIRLVDRKRWRPDVNLDGRIDLFDLTAIARMNQTGTDGAAAFPAGDVDDDRAITLTDLALAARAYGR